jgi:hypothetical protein
MDLDERAPSADFFHEDLRQVMCPKNLNDKVTIHVQQTLRVWQRDISP